MTHGHAKDLSGWRPPGGDELMRLHLWAIREAGRPADGGVRGVVALTPADLDRAARRRAEVLAWAEERGLL